MRCDKCPALIYGRGMDDEYWSSCKLGYQQIEYKDNSDYTYCMKSLKRIKKEVELIDKIEYLKRYNISIKYEYCINSVKTKDLMTTEQEILNKIEKMEKIFNEIHKKYVISLYTFQLYLMSYNILNRITKICDEIIILDYNNDIKKGIK